MVISPLSPSLQKGKYGMFQVPSVNTRESAYGGSEVGVLEPFSLGLNQYPSFTPYFPAV